MKDFLLAHLVGDDQDDFVVLLAGNESKGKAGISSRGFHQRPARLQAAIALRRFDHRDCDTVLNGAAGILALQLQVELTLPHRSRGQFWAWTK